MAFDLSTARRVDAPPAAAPAPAAPTGGFDLSTAKPADPAGNFVPIDNRSVSPAAYVGDWARRVAGSVVNPEPHSDLPRAPMAPGVLPGVGALEAGASALTGLVSPVTGAAVTSYHRMTDDPNYPLAQGAADATYSPRTAQGAKFNDVLGAVFQPLSDASHLLGGVAGEDVGRMGGSPRAQADAGTLVEQGINTAAAFAGGRKAAEPAAAVPPGSLPVGGAAGEAVARLRGNRFLIPPEVAKAKLALESPELQHPSVPGDLVSGLVNRGPANEMFTIENAKVVQSHVADEFGLPRGTKAKDIPEALGQVAKSQNPAYEMVKQAIPNLNTEGVQSAFDRIGANRRDNPLLGEIPKVKAFRDQLQQAGTVTTQQALDAIREWRADAGRYFNATGGDAVVNEQTARAYRSAADALEKEIGTQLQATGNEHVFSQFENARTVQAKIHNVLDSWKGDHLDPQALLRLRNQGVNLTGRLADIADAAEHAPDVVRSPTGSSIASPSAGNGGHSTSVAESEIRRLLFDKWGINRLLSDKVQGKYGTPNPRTPNTIAPPTPPFGDPNVGPPVPPPGGNFPNGRFPNAPAGEGPLSLADEFGGVPFSETQLPVQAPAGMMLSEHAPLDLGASRAPDTGLTLPGPLDEVLGSNPGIVGEPFHRVPGKPPGTQPGLSVGLADALNTDPHGTVLPWPEIPGPSDLGPSSRTPKVGGPVPNPGNLNLSPGDAHLLVTSLADLLSRPSTDEVPHLPPELQAIRDMGHDVQAPPAGPLSGALAEILAGIPEGPPKPLGPPKGSKALRPLADEFNVQNEPRGAAGPEDFGGGVSVEPKRPAPAVPGGAELSLGDAIDRPAAPDIAGGEPKYEPPPNAIRLKNKGREIDIEPVGDRLVLRHTFVEPEMRKRGLGVQNLVDAVKYAIKHRKPIDSDSSFRPGAWGAWKAAFRDGILEADNVPYAEIEAAFERDPGRAATPSGESWIKDIRLGPKAE